MNRFQMEHLSYEGCLTSWLGTNFPSRKFFLGAASGNGMNILEGRSAYPTIVRKETNISQAPNWRGHVRFQEGYGYTHENYHGNLKITQLKRTTIIQISMFWVPAVNFWGCMISILCHGKDIGKDKGKTFKPCCHASSFIKLASIEKLT